LLYWPSHTSLWVLQCT